MAILQPLFQQNDITDQTANITRLLLRDLMAERHGIIQETAFQVAQRGAGANNSVDVGAGGIIIPGTENGQQGYYYVANDATVNLPMSLGADTTNPRIDSIIVEVRDSFYSGANNDARLVYVTGTPAGSPVEPNLTALGFKNYYRLANINVPANDNTIVTGDITDRRLTNPQGRASAVGGIVVCTSTTKPTTPRRGQFIWLDDLKRVEVNEGTSAVPVWTTYALPISSEWVNFTPTFAGLTGASNTVYGRYFRIGPMVVGICGFLIGTGGNITGTINSSLPASFPVKTGIGSVAVYMGFGRAFDSSANVYYSCTAEVLPNGTNLMQNFSTAGTAGWNATIPFNWDPADKMHMMFCYETP